jgi:hypothetical protein
MYPYHEQSLKDILREVADSMNWKAKLNEAKIKEIWAEKMGTTINFHTTQVKLRRDKLFIYINSSSLKHDLSFQKDKIKEFFNLELGGDVIKEVSIV